MQWRTDWKGRMIYANHDWQEFTGLSVKQIEGDPCAHLIHPDDLARIASEGAFCMAMRRAFYGRFRHLHQEGWREVLVYSEPVFENGIYRGYAGITRAIAEHSEIITSLPRAPMKAINLLTLLSAIPPLAL